MRRLPRVEVEWRDSCSRGMWDSIEGHRKRNGVGPILSIGYLLQKTKQVVQLAQSHSVANDDVTDTITIPSENVVRMKRITGGLTR